MPDTPPLLFTIKQGALLPANKAAEEVVRRLGGGVLVRAEIKRATANVRRMALYWAVADVAAENLGEQVTGEFDAQMLHQITKKKLGLCEQVELPSGDRYFNCDSIRFESMTEPDRAKYIDRAFAMWSRWLRADVTELLGAANAPELDAVKEDK
jgi:hypothetical protein